MASPRNLATISLAEHVKSVKIVELHHEIARVRNKCQIPSDWTLEFLFDKFQGWEENPRILLRLPSFSLNFTFKIFDFRFILFTAMMQVSLNGIRYITRFLLLSLINDLHLTYEDFLYCYHIGEFGKKQTLEW